MKPRLKRFASAKFFTCPICHHALILHEQSLKCTQKHSFDLAKYGYVNLAPHAKPLKDYDKGNFQDRNTILEAGYYQHILEKISDILHRYPNQQLLDSGCGEGYYARKLQAEFPESSFYAFDLSKESIQLAAKKEEHWAVRWFVGDLTRLPLQSHSMDIILDIFSPAHYQEFQRVLKSEGLLIKVIPTAQHVQEIRTLVADQLQEESYSNQTILEHFQQSFEIVEQHSLTATLPLSADTKEALLNMTPLLFHLDRSQFHWDKLHAITIAALVIVGKKSS